MPNHKKIKIKIKSVRDRAARERKRKATHTPITDNPPDSTAPTALVAGKATPIDAIHIATPMTCVKVTASRGTKGNAARVPSALAMARLWRDGVGENGRRAWPPRRSSMERTVARIGGRGDMVWWGGFGEGDGGGGVVRVRMVTLVDI